jgi:hypothetical protein
MGFFEKSVVLEYLGGCPKIKGKKVKVKKGAEPNTLNIDGTEFPITSVQWQEKGERSAGKAAVGAVVGGLLTGGIGMIAGAAIGGRKKDVSTAVIGLRDGVVDYTIYLRCDHKEFQQLTSLL